MMEGYEAQLISSIDRISKRLDAVCAELKGIREALQPVLPTATATTTVPVPSGPPERED